MVSMRGRRANGVRTDSRRISLAPLFSTRGLDGDAAMDEVLRALALDPENDAAREVLRKLLVAAPSDMSKEAEAELRRDHDARRARDIRSAMYGWLAMTIPMPFTAMLGNVKWGWTLGAFSMIASMIFVSWHYARLPRLSRAQVYTYIALAGAATMASSMWLGPFIMLPVSAGLMTTFFEPGRVVLVSRFADVEPRWTLLGLVWTSVAFAPFAGWVAGRLRDALTDAERRLFAHAWQLRRITHER